MKSFLFSRDAITRVQATAIAVIIVVAVVASVAIYYVTRPPAPAPPIKIGIITPLAAPADYVSGEMIRDTVELFVAYQNEKGGLLGRPLETVVADQTLDSGVAIGHLARMVTEHKIVALFGLWESLVALPVAEATDEYPTIMFVTYSWADDITRGHHKYVFRVGVFNSLSARVQIDFLKWAGYKSAVGFVEESPYGFGVWEAMEEYAAEAYPELKLTQIVTPMGLADYSPQILKVKAMDPLPEVAIIALNIPHCYVVQKQSHELGLPDLGVKLMGGWDYAFVDPSAYWDALGEAGVGLIIPSYSSPYLEYTDVGEEFVSLYKEKFGKMPPVWIAWDWDALTILAKAIEDTESTDPDVLAEYIENIDIVGTTGRITFVNDPDPDSILWHQWLGMPSFFFEFTEIGQTAETAPQIYPPL